MKPAPSAARDLLHLVDHGALGTLLAGDQGQPFVTAMPFAPDENNAPIFLTSRLAEHTRNLDQDARASLLLQADLPGEEGGVLAQTRMTLIGESRRFEPDAALVARFLRYQPDAERYLALGDFGFFRFQVKRARLIGGFGSMGWLPGEALAPSALLAPAQEAQWIEAIREALPAGWRMLGIDREGVDLLRDGRRERRHFAGPLADADALDRLRATLADA